MLSNVVELEKGKEEEEVDVEVLTAPALEVCYVTATYCSKTQ